MTVADMGYPAWVSCFASHDAGMVLSASTSAAFAPYRWINVSVLVAMISYRLRGGLPSCAAFSVVARFAGAPCDGSVCVVEGFTAHDVLEMLRQCTVTLVAGLCVEECFLVGEML